MVDKNWEKAIAEFSDVEAERDGVVVTIEFIGEGHSGDFAADDPHDEPLLRFSVSRRDAQGALESVDDASYCTSLPVDTDREKLTKIAQIILEEVREGVLAGHSVKRLCERYSWVDAEGNVPASAAFALR